MVYNIYSLGDTSFLQKVFNGIAMVTGTGDFVTVCVIGVLFGLLLVAANTVLSGKGPDISNLVICLVIWVFMFGSTVTVNLHDVINDTDRKVDNVPAGVGMCGYVISNIGYGITEIMEQAFQAPTSTSTLTGAGGGSGGKFADALYMLNAIAKLGSDTAVMRAIDKSLGSDANIAKSISNYVTDCTFTKVLMSGSNTNGATISDIMTSDVENALLFDSSMYYTRYYTGTQGGVNATCVDAWDKIRAVVTTALSNGTVSSSLMEKALIKSLMSNDIDPMTGQLKTSITVSEKMESAAMSLGFDGAEMQKLTEASLYYDLFLQGLAQGYRNIYDKTSADMITQARNQRNVQWAAEQSMFVDLMRPMISFIEGFVYAITPFAGFVIMMGMFGIKLFAKYCMLLAWTQSWLPVTAIVNLYLYDGVRSQLAAYRNSGGLLSGNNHLASFYGVNDVITTTQDWIGTAGMFGAAIPLLTLFVFTGSVYSLTTLTGRMAGQDVINEKMRSPDLMTPGAIAKVTDMFTMSNARGVNSGYALQNLNISNLLDNSVTHGTQEQLAYQHTAMSNFTRAYENSSSMNKSTAFKDMITRAMGSTTTEGRNAAFEVGDSMSKAFNMDLSRDETIKLGAELTAIAGLKTDASMKNKMMSDAVQSAFVQHQAQSGGGKTLGTHGSGNASLNLKGSAGITDSNKVAEAFKTAFSHVQGTKDGDALQSQLQKGITDQLTDEMAIQRSFGFSAKEAGMISDAAQKAESYSESVAKAESLRRAVGSNQTFQSQDVANRLLQHGYADKLTALGNEFMGDSFFKSHYTDLASHNVTQALPTAVIDYMATSDNPDHKVQLAQMLTDSGIFQGGPSRTVSDNASLGVNPQAIEAQRGAYSAGANNGYMANQQKAAPAYDVDEAAINAASEKNKSEVNGFYGKGRQEVSKQRSDNLVQMNSPHLAAYSTALTSLADKAHPEGDLMEGVTKFITPGRSNTLEQSFNQYQARPDVHGVNSDAEYMAAAAAFAEDHTKTENPLLDNSAVRNAAKAYMQQYAFAYYKNSSMDAGTGSMNMQSTSAPYGDEQAFIDVATQKGGLTEKEARGMINGMNQMMTGSTGSYGQYEETVRNGYVLAFSRTNNKSSQ
ncbi:MAG: conjugal transfer protein TraG N-terminal domain-containing protein [Succinivibrio sp.]|nr:conjugal transfer protein TraG N-terminal domain-containing protein [Succinivibrio sp.]